jgi:excisionase family DNA binding protein
MSKPEAIFLRPSEAAALAGLSTRAIYRAVQRGELEAVRLCSRLRIPRAAFDDWIESARVRPPRLDSTSSPVAVPRPRPDGSFRRLLAAVPERRAGR